MSLTEIAESQANYDASTEPVKIKGLTDKSLQQAGKREARWNDIVALSRAAVSIAKKYQS